jgi:hypothetical protein
MEPLKDSFFKSWKKIRLEVILETCPLEKGFPSTQRKKNNCQLSAARRIPPHL